jgi:hypothetical protein
MYYRRPGMVSHHRAASRGDDTAIERRIDRIEDKLRMGDNRRGPALADGSRERSARLLS